MGKKLSSFMYPIRIKILVPVTALKGFKRIYLKAGEAKTNNFLLIFDYMGVPVAKSKELLQNILREEWGFSGFIVSDCGAIGNLTARKHYTAKDKIEAANQALAAGIATNCGDTYNDKEVIQAAIC